MKAKPKKHFGQHFLTDKNIIHKIIESFSPEMDQLVCEIGPGQGALTQELIKKVSVLHAIEIDQTLAQELQLSYPKEKLIVHEKDILQFPFDQLSTKEHSIRLIGNLPYNISTPILFHTLGYRKLIKDMLFMLQKDVVDRIVAKPNNKIFGRLSVMIQAYCHTQALFTIAPNCFFPPPKVQSTIVQLRPKEDVDIISFRTFSNVVRLAFGQRRKTLRNSLKNLVTPQIFTQLAIDPKLRAENLSVNQFIILANSLCK